MICFQKRLLVLLITCIVLIVFILLPGCSTNTKNEVETDQPSNSFTSNLPPVNIKFLFGGAKKNDTAKVLEMIEDKTKSTLNAKLDFRWIPWLEYFNTIAVLSASNDCFDAFVFEDYYGYYNPKMYLRSLLNEGAILDISNIFAKNAPKLYNSYSPEDIEYAKFDGKLLMVPTRIFMTSRIYAIVREDLVTKYKSTGINSYEDLDKYLNMLKSNESNIIPLMLAGGLTDLFANMSGYVVLSNELGLVYKWDDPSMKLIAWEQTPEYKKAVETLFDWYRKGYLLQDVEIPKDLEWKFAANGGVGAFISNWDGDSAANAQSGASNIKYKAFQLYPDKVFSKALPSSLSVMFSSKAENPERAMMFMEWLNLSQENYDLFMYGIKDEHYALKNEFVVMPKGVTNYNNTYLGWDGYWGFLNMDFIRPYMGEPSDKWSKLKKADLNNTKYAPHGNFIPDYTSLSNDFSIRQYTWATLNRPQIHKMQSFNDIDTLINDAKLTNQDKLIKEVQQQLDRWKAKSR